MAQQYVLELYVTTEPRQSIPNGEGNLKGNECTRTVENMLTL
jgi:hypothetical protein